GLDVATFEIRRGEDIVPAFAAIKDRADALYVVGSDPLIVTRRVPHIARQLERGPFNRFLATLPPHEFGLLAPHLRTIALERGVMLHDVGEDLEHGYFPHTGMVSLVSVMQSGATVESATIGRAGVIGASIGLGAKQSFGRAIVQLPGTAAWLSAAQFHAVASQSQGIRDLIVRYNDRLLAQ